MDLPSIYYKYSPGLDHARTPLPGGDMAHIRQPRTDFVLDFRVEVFEPFEVFPSWLSSSAVILGCQVSVQAGCVTFENNIFKESRGKKT